MHNAMAITTGSADQRFNTPCIRLWIDVTFWGLEDSYNYMETIIVIIMDYLPAKFYASCVKYS